jgi:hypothetical protein
LQIHSEPYEVAAMATETRDQSASQAEVFRSFFTDRLVYHIRSMRT